MLAELRLNYWRHQFRHKLCIIFAVRTPPGAVEHAELRHNFLALLVTLKQNPQGAERLSLVPNLVNNTVKSCQVRGLGNIGENFFLSHSHINLVNVACLEQLLEQVGVRLPSYEDVNLARIVAQVDAICAQIIPLECLDLKKMAALLGASTK